MGKRRYGVFFEAKATHFHFDYLVKIFREGLRGLDHKGKIKVWSPKVLARTEPDELEEKIEGIDFICWPDRLGKI